MSASLSGIAMHTAVWGDPEALLDAIDAGAWLPGHFDPEHRQAAQLMLDMTLAGEPPWPPEVVAERLHATGMPRGEVLATIDPPGAFEAAGCRLDGLPHHLHRLAEDHERQHLTRQLLSLASALEVPGGPSRVRAALQGAAA